MRFIFIFVFSNETRRFDLITVRAPRFPFLKRPREENEEGKRVDFPIRSISCSRRHWHDGGLCTVEDTTATAKSDVSSVVQLWRRRRLHGDGACLSIVIDGPVSAENVGWPTIELSRGIRRRPKNESAVGREEDSSEITLGTTFTRRARTRRIAYV